MRSSKVTLTRLRLLIAPVLVGGLALAACGGDDDDDDAATASTSPTAATTAVSAGATAAPGSTVATADNFNDADVEFAQRMIAHHEQAIEMAEMAQDPARQAGPEVLDLATRIEAAQDPEIETMTSWLAAWDQPAAMDTSEGHDMSSMGGPMSAEDMDALTAMTAAEFDDMWLTMMIEHHQGAIEMATDIQTAGTNPDVNALAAEIVSAQQAEVDEMTALLDG